jgi:hypothetical protein
MCFSANASFTAGVVLSAIGIATLKKAKKPSSYLFASIPLLFALQQIDEGFLWLSLQHIEFSYIKQFCTHFFIFIAQVIWTMLVPLSIMLLTPMQNRNTYQKIVVGIGSVLSVLLLFCLIVYPNEAFIQEHHIKYIQHYPSQVKLLFAVLYIIATISPLFLTRIPLMKLLGVLIVISYLLATFFYQTYLLSVWCFFSSIISIVIFFIIKKMAQKKY